MDHAGRLTSSLIPSALDVRNHRTFEEIYHRTRPLLKLIVRRSRVPAGEGEEMVQDAFLRLYESLGAFASHPQARAFLVKTLRHMIIDRCRRRRCHQTEVMDLDDMPYHVTEESFTPFQYETAVLAVGQMVKKIAQQKGAEAFWLYYASGLSVREISVKTGEPVGSITAKLCRLRKRHQAAIRQHVQVVAGI